MPPPKKEHSLEAVALAIWLTARTTPRKEVAKETGISEGTLKRRAESEWAERIAQERKSPTPDPRRPPTPPAQIATDPPPAVAAPPASAPIDADPSEDEGDDPAIGDFSVGATLAEIDKWLAVAKKRAEAAAENENPKIHAEYMRMIIQLLEARRKAAPAPKVDPNDSPDMVENAAKVRERWHEKADALFRVASSPLAETIGKILRGEIKTT